MVKLSPREVLSRWYLDDPRLSRTPSPNRRLTEWAYSLWQAAVLRSGMLTLTIIAILLLGFAFAWREHMKGQFGRLKRELKGPAAAVAPPPPLPGGQDPIVLERSTIEGGSVPEFLSATLLPGRGMNIFQIKAYLPSKGEVELLSSPPLEEAGRLMNGKNSDANGAASLSLGAAFEAPWAGRIFGAPSGNNSINTSWNGTAIHLPSDRSNGIAVATGGLLLKAASNSVKTNVMPDGGDAEATYESGSFDEHWPSKLRITSTAQLSGRVLDIKLTALNVGDTAAPVGLGWHPLFRVIGNRGSMVLRLPSQARIERSHANTPTGKLLPVTGTRYDFSDRMGSVLGNAEIDDTFVHLRQAPLDNGPVAELRDPTNNFGLRMTLLSPSIKALHVSAPADGKYVMISPQFNYDDPFGRQWSREEDTGMIVLQPGQSTQWRVRLEIFALTSNSLQ